MANPFKAHFNSKCNNCGENLFENEDDVFAHVRFRLEAGWSIKDIIEIPISYANRIKK